MNLPNKLTVFRVVLIPFFLFFYFADKIPYNMFIAAAIFVVAAATDALDGKIARARGLVTNFGKLMDPLADKLLVTSAMVCILGGSGGYIALTSLIMSQGSQSYHEFSQGLFLQVMPVLALIIVLSRDLIVTSIRLVAAGGGHIIAADIWGKVKTVLQMVWTSLSLINLGFYQELSNYGTLPANIWFKGFYKISVIAELVLFVAMIAMTVASGINYVIKNRSLFADA